MVKWKLYIFFFFIFFVQISFAALRRSDATAGAHFKATNAVAVREKIDGKDASNSESGDGAGAGNASIGAADSALYTNPREKQKQAYYQQLLSRPWGKVAVEFIDQLQKEEAEFLKQIHEMLNITPERWQRKLSKYQLGYAQAQNKKRAELLKCKTDQVIVKRINTFLTKLNIDPQSIDIFTHDYAERVNYMHSTRDWISIRSMHAALYAAAIIKADAESEKNLIFYDAIVMHEIMHILHEENFIKTCILILATKKNLQGDAKVAFDALIEKYATFKERRADILAMLYDFDYAKAMAEHFKYKFAQELVSEMEKYVSKGAGS